MANVNYQESFIPVKSITTKKQANIITGGLSNPSKMPGFSYGLPAKECKIGSKLRNIKGSTCEKCYALKGMYAFGNVQAAQYKRLESIYSPDWVPAMVKLISGQEYFRWHDSGDLQSIEHLFNICKIVAATPDTKHWLPTREKGLILEYLRRFGAFPKNLVVRLSAAMIDSNAVKLPGINTSSVHNKKQAIGFECPAPLNNNECGNCRACWNKSIDNVSYHQH